MSRWLVRSSVPMALLIAVGLIALIGTLTIPTTTVESIGSSTTAAGVPDSPPVVTVDHQSAAIAIVLLVVAVASFGGAITLGVLRRRARRIA